MRDRPLVALFAGLVIGASFGSVFVLVDLLHRPMIGCPKQEHIAVRTITTPTLVLQDGVWMTQRRIEETASR